MKRFIALGLIPALSGCLMGPTLHFPTFGGGVASTASGGASQVDTAQSFVLCPADLAAPVPMLPLIPPGAEIPAITDQDPPDLQAGFPIFNAWMAQYGSTAKSLFQYASKAHDYCVAQLNSQGAKQ